MVSKLLRNLLAPVRGRVRYRRLVEFDGSLLLQKYGVSAVARALELEAQGVAFLHGGRRRGHWRRVARCIAGRPLPSRTETAFG